MPVADPITLIDSVNAHYVIFGCSIFAILWGALNALWVSTISWLRHPMPPLARCTYHFGVLILISDR